MRKRLGLSFDAMGRATIVDLPSRGSMMGFSLNPFKAISKAASGVTHLATGAITSAAHLYNKVTPNDLKSVLRWTPMGLSIRAGAKIAPQTLKVLGSAVKWTPAGMTYRGANYALSR